MENIKIAEENNSSKITVDLIIEKFIPIIGAILFVSGLGYLLYTNVWVILPEMTRIIIGFITSIAIILGGVKLGTKLNYFGDVVIGIGVLLLYGTLIYGSRSNGMANASIPEIESLAISFVFTYIIAYFATKRNSKVIFILTLLGAYLTPFVIGQNGTWLQNVPFNTYLIYFTAINVILFKISKDVDISNIMLLNRLGLIFGTSTLYNLSYYSTTTNIGNSFFSSALFSGILFLILTIFSITTSLVSKTGETRKEGYLAIGYLGTIFWFLYNIGLLSINDTYEGILYIILAIFCFGAWYKLAKQNTNFEHSALYSSGVLSLVLAFSSFIPEINSFISLVISYVSLIFALLYFFDNSKKERLITYYLFSIIGALYSLSFAIFSNLSIFGFTLSKTIYIIIALLPMLAAYLITRKDEDDIRDLASFYSIIGLVFIGFILILKIINFINFDFFVFYIVPLFGIIYLYINQNLSINTKTSILRALLVWFACSYIFTFITMLGMLYPSPSNTHIFGANGILSNIILIKGVFASIILFLGLKLSRKLDENDVEYHPVFLVSMGYYLSIFVLGNQIIFAIINDLGVSQESGGARAIFATLYWIILSIFLIFTGVRYMQSSEKILGIILVLASIIKIVFYDMATMNMNNKIIVLMIVGGLLLMFSYLIHKNNWLKPQKIESKKPKKVEKVKENFSINEKIKDIDVSGIEKVKFNLKDDTNFTIKSSNLFKIIKSVIIYKNGKTSFEAGELKSIYDYTIDNYKSNLNKDDYDKITSLVKNFVDIGGSIEIIDKGE